MTAAQAFASISGTDDDLPRVVAVCDAARDYCPIGGTANNCSVNPVHTMDADFAPAADHLEVVNRRLGSPGFKVEVPPHSLSALRPGSQLRIQFTEDARYAEFPARAEILETPGLRLRVASLLDWVRAKTGAWSSPQPRLSKRKKDELDLIRAAEGFIPRLPEAVRRQLA